MQKKESYVQNLYIADKHIALFEAALSDNLNMRHLKDGYLYQAVPSNAQLHPTLQPMAYAMRAFVLYNLLVGGIKLAHI
ncbi:hypothetical protein [Xylanibacter rarus]|uniref:hypothetical protein n=1 Tax=Xylanibacter rarus TaxID=1676614 RepID=UPI003FEE9A3C